MCGTINKTLKTLDGFEETLALREIDLDQVDSKAQPCWARGGYLFVLNSKSIVGGLGGGH